MEPFALCLNLPCGNEAGVLLPSWRVLVVRAWFAIVKCAPRAYGMLAWQYMCTRNAKPHSRHSSEVTDAAGWLHRNTVIVCHTLGTIAEEAITEVKSSRSFVCLMQCTRVWNTWYDTHTPFPHLTHLHSTFIERGGLFWVLACGAHQNMTAYFHQKEGVYTYVSSDNDISLIFTLP